MIKSEFVIKATVVIHAESYTQAVAELERRLRMTDIGWKEPLEDIYTFLIVDIQAAKTKGK